MLCRHSGSHAPGDRGCKARGRRGPEAGRSIRRVCSRPHPLGRGPTGHPSSPGRGGWCSNRPHRPERQLPRATNRQSSWCRHCSTRQNRRCRQSPSCTGPASCRSLFRRWRTHRLWCCSAGTHAPGIAAFCRVACVVVEEVDAVADHRVHRDNHILGRVGVAVAIYEQGGIAETAITLQHVADDCDTAAVDFAPDFDW